MTNDSDDDDAAPSIWLLVLLGLFWLLVRSLLRKPSE